MRELAEASESPPTGDAGAAPPDPLVWQRAYVEFLSAVPASELSRLYTLYNVGLRRLNDPPREHRDIAEAATSRAQMIGVLASRVLVARAVDRGLAVLVKLGVEPNAAWHEQIPIASTPRDFIRDPVWPRPRRTNQASFDELVDLWREGSTKRVLVASADPDMGPYTRCILVPESNVSHWLQCGYRALTDSEKYSVEDVPFEDFTEGWKHSD
jgi:hypothetical protein